jgi:hypothetical protein
LTADASQGVAKTAPRNDVHHCAALVLCFNSPESLLRRHARARRGIHVFLGGTVPGHGYAIF